MALIGLVGALSAVYMGIVTSCPAVPTPVPSVSSGRGVSTPVPSLSSGFRVPTPVPSLSSGRRVPTPVPSLSCVVPKNDFDSSHCFIYRLSLYRVMRDTMCKL
jgi:hypothetical protein